ncbi:hypothetical protein BKA63DRAFT_85062 [Paraphoma chrysanthemicola]|nr:hypothetical protein BKA63DRAFT_85062 [Paraphoma chrysanthemicola]
MAKIEKQELMLLLNSYCNPTYSHSHRSKSQVLIGMVTPADLLLNGLKGLDPMDRPLFSTSATCPESHVSADCGDGADAVIPFRQIDDVVQREKIVADALAQKLARSPSMAHDDVDRDRPLVSYGVDSVVAVERRD